MPARAHDRRPHAHRADQATRPHTAAPSSLDVLHDRLGAAGAAAWLQGAPLSVGEQVLQAKLTVGSATDPAEHEADRAAEAILAGRRASVTPDSTVRRRAEGAGAAFDAGPSVASALARQAGGSPLGAGLRARAESSLGTDLSEVRVHGDASARSLAGSLSAQAFTRGTDVYLGPGAPAAGTAAGDRLLAHEVAHVAQQQQAAGEPLLRRKLDPLTFGVTDAARIRSVRPLRAGGNNLGILLLGDTDGGPATVVVKFLRREEATERQVGADAALRAAGVKVTSGGRSAGADVRDAVLDRAAHLRQKAERLAPQDPAMAKIVQDLVFIGDDAKRSPMVMVMPVVGGEMLASFQGAAGPERADELRKQAGSDVWSSPTVLRQLGRIAVADSLMGNADRFAVQRGKDFAIVNEQNMHLVLDRKAVIGTVDSDTLLFSRRAFANSVDPLVGKGNSKAAIKKEKKRAKNAKPRDLGVRAWVDALVNGQVADIGAEAAKSQGVEWVFSESRRRVLYEAWLDSAAASSGGPKPSLTFEDFDADFNLGAQQAMKRLLAALRPLKATMVGATPQGQEEAGQGLADRSALSVRGAYLKQRDRGRTAAQAQDYALNKARVLGLLDGVDDPLKVPPPPSRSGLLRRAAATVSSSSAAAVKAKQASRDDFIAKIDDVADLVAWRRERVGTANADMKLVLSALNSTDAAERQEAVAIRGIVDAKADRLQDKTDVVLKHVAAWRKQVDGKSSRYEASLTRMGAEAHGLKASTHEFLRIVHAMHSRR